MSENGFHFTVNDPDGKFAKALSGIHMPTIDDEIIRHPLYSTSIDVLFEKMNQYVAVEKYEQAAEVKRVLIAKVFREGKIISINPGLGGTSGPGPTSFKIDFKDYTG